MKVLYFYTIILTTINLTPLKTRERFRVDKISVSRAVHQFSFTSFEFERFGCTAFRVIQRRKKLAARGEISKMGLGKITQSLKIMFSAF